MATARSTSKAQTDTDPAEAKAETESTDTDPAETAAGGPKVVPFVEGPDHGYVGQIHPDKDNDAYTVAGVTGSTASATDKPSRSSVDAREAWAPLQG